MRQLGWTLYPLLGLGLAFTAAAEPAVGPPALPARVEPVILLDGQTIAACGFSARFELAQGAVDVGVHLMRTPGGTAFEISATQPDGSTSSRLVGLALITGAFDTARKFPLAHVEQGRLVTRTPLPGFEGTEFIRGVMVGGARIELTDEAGRILSLSLPGPLPHTVRASYLACAGDLVGPSGE